MPSEKTFQDCYAELERMFEEAKSRGFYYEEVQSIEDLSKGVEIIECWITD